MEDDCYLKAATTCFGLAHNYLRKPTSKSAALNLREYYQGSCEIVCFLLHLSDRLIFEVVPNSRQFRMDQLVLASLHVFVKEVRDNVQVKRPTNSEDSPEYGAHNRIVTREQVNVARKRINEALNQEVLGSANSEATEIFKNLYEQRADEYGSVGQDWFRIILSKFGRHFCEAVNGGELSPEIYLDVQGEAVRMHATLANSAPWLFRPGYTFKPCSR